ncbi:MAG: hypothetical protein GX615_12560 [Lentisphaerae bacterium]|nr:hypothetical protein [Lentisphaerota bacterium]
MRPRQVHHAVHRRSRRRARSRHRALHRRDLRTSEVQARLLLRLPAAPNCGFRAGRRCQRRPPRPRTSTLPDGLPPAQVPLRGRRDRLRRRRQPRPRRRPQAALGGTASRVLSREGEHRGARGAAAHPRHRADPRQAHPRAAPRAPSPELARHRPQRPQRPQAAALRGVQLEIRDAALKQALFAIWLGDKPAQDSLKQALLGH